MNTTVETVKRIPVLRKAVRIGIGILVIVIVVWLSLVYSQYKAMHPGIAEAKETLLESMKLSDTAAYQKFSHTDIYKNLLATQSKDSLNNYYREKFIEYAKEVPK